MKPFVVPGGWTPLEGCQVVDVRIVYRPPGWRRCHERARDDEDGGPDIDALLAEAELPAEHWDDDETPLGQHWTVITVQEQPAPGFPAPYGHYDVHLLDAPGADGPVELIVRRLLYPVDPGNPEFARIEHRRKGKRRGPKPKGEVKSKAGHDETGTEKAAGARPATIARPHPEIAPGGTRTRRLERYVVRHLCQRPIAAVARETGLAESTTADIFYPWAGEVDAVFPQRLPRYLGIDNKDASKRHFTQFTDLMTGEVVEVIEGQTAEAVTAALSRFSGGDAVVLVTMDYAAPYAKAVRTALPKARIVSDKRHMLFHILQAMRDVRSKTEKDVRANTRKGDPQRAALAHSFVLMTKRRHELTTEESEKLAITFAEFPKLKLVYDAKEAWYDIFQKTTQGARQAKRAIGAWLRTWVMGRDAPQVTRDAYGTAAKTIVQRLQDIVAYFDPTAVLPDGRRATNAATEALNGEIKRLHVERRGFGKRDTMFAHFRLHVLHRCGKRSWEASCAALARAQHRASTGGGAVPAAAVPPPHSDPLVRERRALMIGDTLSPAWLERLEKCFES